MGLTTDHDPTPSVPGKVAHIVPLIELHEVSRTFVTGGGVEVRAVDGVSLSINAGEFVAIMGQSGSGKTTLMNLLGCLDRPTDGTYRLAGRDVESFDANGLAWLRREAFGFVFQNYNLLPTATAEENVEIPAIYAGMSYAQRRDRANQLLSSLGLGDRRGHRPNQLSGGEQQRVSIARALMNGGQIILADEPTGALDSQASTEIIALLSDLARRGHTVIIITHDQTVAVQTDRQIEMLDGRIVRDSGMDGQSPQVGIVELPDLTVPVDNAQTAASFGDTIEATRMAMRSLRTNPFRTFLTLLGVVIGVASVVTMLAIGEGAKQRIALEINALGANRLAVWPNIKEFPGAKLPFDDAAAIALNIENVAAVLPELSGTATIRIGNVDYESSITATSAEFPVVRDWPLASGVFFDHHDSESHAPVAVLGATALAHLFADGGNPLGEYVLIKNVPFLVIGTMTQKGASGFGRNDQDDVVIVPLKTGARRLFGKTSLRALTVTVTDSSRIDRTESQLRLLLTELHGEEDFNVLNSTEMQENMAEAMSTATLILAAIGAISLLVGGIGIMNIMLVSVIERTREIGIRVATGARRSDILVQFLVEAMVVSGVGGLIGIGLGIAIGLFISLLFSEVNVTFTGLPMIVAFACAAATGLVFGFTPARNAARLDPVVALASD